MGNDGDQHFFLAPCGFYTYCFCVNLMVNSTRVAGCQWIEWRNTTGNPKVYKVLPSNKGVSRELLIGIGQN
jgi:hypothetical protein